MIFEKDLGSALLFFVLFLSVLWVATQRASYLVVGGALFAAGATMTWAAFEHVHQRVAMWLNPWSDPLGKGYQIIQAQYALAWGGAGGVGLGLGISGRIPFQETDFIFAIIGEELGLFGAAAVLIAFLLMAGSGFRIAARAIDPFSKLLATGLTTPFLSYGGSSLVANWIIIALLVRISDDAEAPVAPPEDEATTVLAVR
jgi:cell division protein FtsW (lipid II flippase)